MILQAILTTALAAGAAAFNFGGFNIPIPSLPAGFPTALPTIPTDILPSDIILPQITTIPDFTLPPIPTLKDPLTINSRLPYISVPPMPSFDIPTTEFPSLRGIPSEFAGAIQSRLSDINQALESAGFSRLPTIPADPGAVIASLRGAVASLRDQLGNERDGLQKLVDSYMNTTNRNFTVPASESELRAILEGRGGFNLSRADAILEDLGSKTGQDIRGSIRMISALVFQNASDRDDIFSRATKEFTFHASRIRESAEQVYNFTQTQIRLPALSALNLENKTLNVIQYASNPYQFLSGQKINSQVVSIMISDLAGNETQIRDLADAIRFSLPLNVTDAEYNELLSSGKAACVFWDEAATQWQTDGCSLIDLLPTEARCACNHLTDFAVAPVAVASAAPSPVYAIQLPSPSTAPLAASLTASADVSMRPGIIFAVVSPSSAASSGVPTTTIVGAALGSFLAVGAIALIVANVTHYKRKERAKMAVKSIRTVSPAAVAGGKPVGWV